MVRILCLSFLLVFSVSVRAWTPTNASSGIFYDFANDGNKIYAIGDYGIYSSTGNSQWTQCSGFQGTSIEFINGTLVAGGSLGFKVSSDGSNWTSVSYVRINCLQTRGNNIYAGTESGIMVSVDNGYTWKNISTGLTGSRVTTLTLFADIVFAGLQDDGAYVITSNDSTWVKSGNGAATYLSYLGVVNGKLTASNSTSTYQSLDTGKTWVVNSAIPSRIRKTATYGSNVWAATTNGIYLSGNNGVSWTNETANFPANFTISLGVFNKTVYVSADTYGLWSSDAAIYCDNYAPLTYIQSCGPYTSPSGNLYIQSGVYEDSVMTNSKGCDSIFRVSVTIRNSSIDSITETSCVSYTSGTGQIYNASGEYVDSLQSMYGCDSVVRLFLTIIPESHDTTTQSACDFYLSPSGLSYDSSGTYNDTIPSSSGCDSIITINLTILKTTGNSVVSSCEPYLSPSGNYTYDSSGTYVDTLLNSAGCDSLLTIELTITNIDSLVSSAGNTLTANQSGASYQWIDCSTSAPIIGANDQEYIITTSGSYAVIIMRNGCEKTSACRNVIFDGIKETEGRHFLFYPNPVLNELNFSTDVTLVNASITLKDITGKTSWRVSHQKGDVFHYDLGSVPAGTYFIEINDEDSISRKVMVKQ